MTLGTPKLSDDDCKKIAQHVAPMLLNPVSEEVEEPTAAEVQYTEPIVKICEEELAKCIKALPKGEIIMKGKTSTVRINRSAESMEIIENHLKNRRNWRTRDTIR